MKRIGFGVAIAIAIAIVIVIVVWHRGDDSSRTRSSETANGEHAATSSETTSSSSPGASSSSSPSSPSASSPSSPAARSADIPPEAMQDLAEALTVGRTADVVQLCAAASARKAHAAECTIAACREHLEAKARSWFAEVAEPEQGRVTQACEQVQITVAKPERIRPHRHRRGEVD